MTMRVMCSRHLKKVIGAPEKDDRTLEIKKRQRKCKDASTPRLKDLALTEQI
jgi:hypothetical protein